MFDLWKTFLFIYSVPSRLFLCYANILKLLHITCNGDYHMRTPRDQPMNILNVKHKCQQANMSVRSGVYPAWWRGGAQRDALTWTRSHMKVVAREATALGQGVSITLKWLKRELLFQLHWPIFDIKFCASLRCTTRWFDIHLCYQMWNWNLKRLWAHNKDLIMC